jgi:hypothetical protein
VSDEVVDKTCTDVFASNEDVNPTHRRLRCRQIAVLWSCGMTFPQIAEQLGCTPDTVRNYFKLPECQSDIRTIQNSDLDFIKTRLRPLLPEMCKRLQEDIEDPNSPDRYRAMKFICQIFGFSAEVKPQTTGVGNYEMAIKALLSDTPQNVEPDGSKYLALNVVEPQVILPAAAKQPQNEEAAPEKASKKTAKKAKRAPRKKRSSRKAIEDQFEDEDDMDL